MGWVVSAMPRPLCPQERDPVPIVQEAGWAPWSVWTGAENLAPTGDLFCSFVLCLYFIRTWFFVLTVLQLVVSAYNTNIHAPSGIRTRIPSKRSAPDLRFRVSSHRDRRDSIHGPFSPQRVAIPTDLSRSWSTVVQFLQFVNPHTA